MSENYLRKTIPIDRMDCASCALTIEKEMKKLEGVKDVRINLLMRKVVVTYDPEKIDIPDLEKKIEDLGYRISYKKYESIFDKILKIFKIKPKKEEEEAFIRTINDHEFEALVLKSNKPVALIFMSKNCPSCKRLEKNLKDVEERFKDQVRFYQMDITSTNTWEEYGITSTPILLYFKKGNSLKIESKSAIPQKEEIEKQIEKLIETT